MCHRRQWRRPYRSKLSPLKVWSYSTPGLATTSRSASLGRQARGWCRLHHGRFALNWSRGQSHSTSKSLDILMASMDRKSNLRRNDACLRMLSALMRWSICAAQLPSRSCLFGSLADSKSDISRGPRSADFDAEIGDQYSETADAIF